MIVKHLIQWHLRRFADPGNGCDETEIGSRRRSRLRRALRTKRHISRSVITLRVQQRRRQSMYYRVAIQRQGDHLDRPPSWQWTSTALSSLETLVQFLRRYGALRLDHLRVFSSSSRESLHEQLVQENTGLGSPSVTAAHFLQERLIHSPEVTRGTPARKGGAYHAAVATQPSVNERSREGNGLFGRDMSALESRRLALELGPGGDHDVLYSFVLPPSMPQVLTWMRLLARIQRGELQP